MKNNTLLSILSISLLILFSSCLKDKGFDNGEYGIQPTINKGVSLPQSLGGSFTAYVPVSNQPQVIDGPNFTLESQGAQSNDVNVTFALKPSLIDDYQATLPAFDPNVVLLPSDQYTVNLNAKVPAGQLLNTLKVTILNPNNLSYDKTYCIGFQLVSADNGFQVASNMKEVLVLIKVKNQYDGDYVANGYFYHPSLPRAIENLDKALVTVDAYTVAADLGDLGSSGYYANFRVDPISGVLGITAGFPANIQIFDTELPPMYTAQWPSASLCNNVYDAVKKEYRVRYGYMGSTGNRVTEEIIKLK